jgi:histidyl-tRNA synthetase
MSSKPKFQAIRGVRDLLPPETELWNHVEQTAHEVFATYGFGEIRLPLFEATDLFVRSIGSETDVVSKEMYSFTVGGIQKPQNSLEELIGAVESAWESGAIEQTNENEQRVRKIRELYQNARSSAGTATAITREFGLASIWASISEINKLVGELSLKVTLRPEATASVCRAYIEHNMNQLPQPVKLYYMGPMFRRERPQKGRYRQFYQIGAEILGGPDAPAIDAEVIEMVMTFFGKLELQGVQLDINSIGHSADNCRRGYVAKLKEALEKEKTNLGEDSQRRIETNPLRVLDSKLEREQPIIEKLQRIADHLCDECKTHYAQVKRQLDLRGVPYRENWRLVRGLDYYMRTTFEITAAGLGSQNAVCGGGRYDGLVELLGGSSSTAGGTKGIGFAIGEDRLILSLQESGKSPESQGRDVYIAWMGERAQIAAIRAAKTLRSAGFSVELPPVEQKFGKALGQADKLGAKFALILGDNEVESGEWTLKTLADGSQQKLTEAQLLEFLRKRRDLSP